MNEKPSEWTREEYQKHIRRPPEERYKDNNAMTWFFVVLGGWTYELFTLLFFDQLPKRKAVVLVGVGIISFIVTILYWWDFISEKIKY